MRSELLNAFHFLHFNKSDNRAGVFSSFLGLFAMCWQLFSPHTFQMWTSFLFPRRDFMSIIWTHLLSFIALSSAVRSPQRLPLYWGTRPEHFGICGILSITLLCSDNCGTVWFLSPVRWCNALYACVWLCVLAVREWDVMCPHTIIGSRE